MATIKISEINQNPDNPRQIKEGKFKKLIASVKDHSFMLSLRPIVIDEDNIIIGGNQRYEACKALGWKEVEVTKYGKAEHLIEMEKQEQRGGKIIGYEEARMHFIFTDNISSGGWDFDSLANNYDAIFLQDKGLDVWQQQSEQGNQFKPTFEPTFDTSHVKHQDIVNAGENLNNNIKDGTDKKFVEAMCPECAHEFNILIE